MTMWNGQQSSRLVRSIVSNLSSATAFSTYFSAQTYQIRVQSTLPIWVTIGSTAVVTANSASALIPANVPEYFAVTSGQVLNYISTSTSSGYLVVSEIDLVPNSDRSLNRAAGAGWLSRASIPRSCWPGRGEAPDGDLSPTNTGATRRH